MPKDLGRPLVAIHNPPTRRLRKHNTNGELREHRGEAQFACVERGDGSRARRGGFDQTRVGRRQFASLPREGCAALA